MQPMFPVGFMGGGPTLQNGLIAFWNLDEASGGPYIDSGPNGLDLIANGTPTQAAGLLGNCTEFTRATPDFLTATSDLLRPATYSIYSGWVWFQVSGGVSAGTQHLLTSIYETGGVGANREFFTSLRDAGAGELGRFVIVDPIGTEQSCATPTDFDDTSWAAVYYSLNLTTGDAYIRLKDLTGFDQDATLNGVVDPPITTGTFAVGCNYDGLAVLGFNGKMFSVGLWNRALTSDEQGFDTAGGGMWNNGSGLKYPFV